MNGEEAKEPTPVPEEEKTTEEKVEEEAVEEAVIVKKAEEKPAETKLDQLLAEEPTEKRTQYMIDTEIKTEAKRLQETGELTSEQANKIRGRGIGI